jgi:hypothetical protein
VVVCVELRVSCQEGIDKDLQRVYMVALLTNSVQYMQML